MSLDEVQKHKAQTTTVIQTTTKAATTKTTTAAATTSNAEGPTTPNTSTQPSSYVTYSNETQSDDLG